MDTGFKIGIELEVLLTPRGRHKKDFAELEGFAQFIVDRCNDVPNPAPRAHNDVDGVYEGPNQTSEWSITDDATIKPDRDDQWPLEIVSPILTYQEQSNWRDEARQMFRTVKQICKIECNQSCAVHVHISPPSNSPWSVDTLKSICRSIFYFEGAIEALVPGHRRGNIYTANNRRDNSKLMSKPLSTCLDLLSKCQNSVEIADLMNEDGKRYYSWNFTNLYHGGKATVEFRQAPCAVNEISCLPWVELVVTFVHASKVTSSFQDLRRYSRDIQGMRRFITSHQPSGYKRAVLAQLFTGKYGYVVPKPLGTPTAEEQVNRDAKQAKESGFMKKLEYFQSE